MKLNREGKKDNQKYSVHLLSCSMQVLESSISQIMIEKTQTVVISPYKMSKSLDCNFQTIAKSDRHRAGNELFLLIQ